MWWIIASGALFNLIIYALGAFLTSFLIRYHGLNIDIANRFSATIFGIGGAIGMISGGLLGDALMKRSPGARLLVGAAACLITAPITFVALQQPRGAYWGFAAGMFLSSCFLYVYYSTVYATIQDIVEPRLRGIAMSTYFFVFYIFTAIGLVGFGRFSDARISVAVAAGSSAADARALGLHDALFSLPVLAVLVALVLWGGSRTADRDHAKLLHA
jgi:MFS family permease